MYNYNATRKPIILREYGRKVQQLVEAMGAIASKAERTAQARNVLKLMALLDASNKQSTENTQKHWDALFIISDYTLDVDSPYPIPEKVLPNERASYSHSSHAQQPIKFRNYGRNVERLIQKAVSITDRDEQEKMVVDIVKLMKTFSNAWNKDNVDSNTLLTNLRYIAGDRLAVDLTKLELQHIFSTTQREKDRGTRTSRKIEKRKKPS